jgi:cell wall-associated NlpC family hydrolase
MILPRPLRLLLVVLLTLSLGSLVQPANAATRTAREIRLSKVHAALRVAMAQRGDRYLYGAAGPDRFDCSGLVYFATHRAGFRRVPRTSSQQSRFMHRIPRSAMRAGDFVFFTSGSGVYHVGIYVGRSNGRRMILHAPRTGERVHIDPVWTNGWFAGTLRRR